LPAPGARFGGGWGSGFAAPTVAAHRDGATCEAWWSARDRARDRADAGEPLVRPLLRHAARRPWVRRPAAAAAAQRQERLPSAEDWWRRGAAVLAPEGRRRRGPQPG